MAGRIPASAAIRRVLPDPDTPVIAILAPGGHCTDPSESAAAATAFGVGAVGGTGRAISVASRASDSSTLACRKAVRASAAIASTDAVPASNAKAIPAADPSARISTSAALTTP